MKRVLPCVECLLSLVVVALVCSRSTHAQGVPAAQITHTVIAASGTPAPAGGTWLAFPTVTMNAHGDIAFDAFLGGPSTSGVFLRNGTTMSTVALGGNPDPAAGNFDFVGNAFVSSRRDVLFDTSPIGTFRADREVLTPLVRDGDPAPGGGRLSPFSRVANTRGAIAYLASVAGAAATQGVFRTDGRDTAAIATDDTAPPTGGRFAAFFTPSLNIHGEAAFTAAMFDGAADFGVFRGSGGDLTPILVANQIAPDGSTFADFGDPLINRHGQVVVLALLANGPADSGLFVGDGTHTITIALQGQPAPKGGQFGHRIELPLTLNDRGEVAFNATLTGGASARGIFRGDGQRTTTIALAGTTAPGTTGTFNSFGDIKLGKDGRVAFIATLTPGIGGVDTTTNMGIWVGTSEADLRLVVRTGDLIDGRVLTSLPRFTGQFDMNDDGVVWVGTFPSRATAIVVSRTGDEHE